MERTGLKVFAGICMLIFIISCKNGTNTNKDKIVYTADWESLGKHKVPAWFSDGKFGIYFHWGVYSVPAFSSEWYPHDMYLKDSTGRGKKVRLHHVEKYGENFQYHQFIPDFTAEHFNAEEWATLFRESGAKWAGPVAEHCDNFSLWDSDVNPWNAARMGPKRDIVGELEKAIKKSGLKFTTTFHHQWFWGWYPSWNGLVDTSTTELRSFYGETTLPETFNKVSSVQNNYSPSKKFVATWKAKVFEVVDKYKPDMLWFDSRLNTIPEKDRQEMLAHYYNEAEEWGNPVVFNYKNKDMGIGTGVIDIERGRLDEKVDYAWLTDDSWDWSSWCFVENHQYKSANHILDGFIDIVSKNGCLLLNIGPKADGTIPEEIKKGLLEIGTWLKVHGDAIYKTKPFLTFGEGPTKLKKNRFGGVTDEGIEYGPEDFRFTINGDKLFIIQLGIPKPNEVFVLSTFARGAIASGVKIKSIRLLGNNEKIVWAKTDEGLKLTAPKDADNVKALVYVAVIK